MNSDILVIGGSVTLSGPHKDTYIIGTSHATGTVPGVAIKQNLQKLYEYAKQHPDKHFMVTRLGFSTADDIHFINLRDKAPENVSVPWVKPEEFASYPLDSERETHAT